jgi:hypothetical protein
MAIEHLDFQVDSFGKAIVEPSNEVIENRLPPVAQGAYELLQSLYRLGINSKADNASNLLAPLIDMQM